MMHRKVFRPLIAPSEASLRRVVALVPDFEDSPEIRRAYARHFRSGATWAESQPSPDEGFKVSSDIARVVAAMLDSSATVMERIG